MFKTVDSFKAFSFENLKWTGWYYFETFKAKSVKFITDLEFNMIKIWFIYQARISKYFGNMIFVLFNLSKQTEMPQKANHFTIYVCR